MDAFATTRRLARPLALAALVALSSATAGCITGGGQRGPTLEQRLDGVIGQSERDVISRWGTPDDHYEYSDGGRSLTWAYSYWVESWQETWSCELTLDTDGYGTVTDWHYSYTNDAANPCHDIMDGLS